MNFSLAVFKQLSTTMQLSTTQTMMEAIFHPRKKDERDRRMDHDIMD